MLSLADPAPLNVEESEISEEQATPLDESSHEEELSESLSKEVQTDDPQ